MKEQTNRNQEIKTLRDLGLTLKEIGDKYQLTSQRVKQILDNPHRTNIYDEKREKIRQMLLDSPNKSAVTIAQRLNTTPSTVKKHAKEMGIKLPKLSKALVESPNLVRADLEQGLSNEDVAFKWNLTIEEVRAFANHQSGRGLLTASLK
jgi:DNA-binding CsgD family transcriptional regulator